MWKALLFSIFMPSCFILSIYFLFFRVLFIEILSGESLQPDSIKTGYYAIEGSSTYPVDAVVLTLSML